MSIDSNTPPDDEDSPAPSKHSHASLTERYQQQWETSTLPVQYETFSLDSPHLIDSLSNDLMQMSSLRARACFNSIVDSITERANTHPQFEPVSTKPSTTTKIEQENSNLKSFFIGLSIDTNTLPTRNTGVKPGEQIILDADIVGLIESPIGDKEEKIVATSENLLDFDYIVICQVLDDVIYSSQVTGNITCERLCSHLTHELSVRSQLISQNEQIYKAIYKSTLEEVINEHYRKHYSA